MSPVLQHYMAAPLRLRWYTVATAVLFVLVAPAAAAQPVALLPAELSMLVAAAIDTHPSIKRARANRRAALQDIDAARRAKWPTVSATTEANVGGPDTTSQVAAIRIEQTLWDQGGQEARIAAVMTGADISALQLDLEQQDLAMQTINAWQALLAAQRRYNAANATVNIIAGFKAQMARRVDAQASPAIDLELVDARLLQTQVERLSAENNVQLALQNLSRLTGINDLSARPWVAPSQVAAPLTRAGEAAFEAAISRANWDAVVQGHPLVTKARLEYSQVGEQLRAKQADRWPQAYARIDQPLANNPFTGSNQATLLIGLRYTPGAGFSTQLEAQALATRLEAQAFEIDKVARTVDQLIYDDQQTFSVSVAHAAAQSLSLAGSQRVLASYERQFQAGRKTWQDLLNAAREVAQNAFSLSDTQSTIQGAMYRLQVRLGVLSTMTEH